jgi:hypothetical protein
MTTSEKLETSPGTCAGHTPGPWKAAGWERTAVIAASGDTICAAAGAKGAELGELKANARLIAAAPAMLEALRDLLPIAEKHAATSYGADACRIARDTIATATGEGGEA